MNHSLFDIALRDCGMLEAAFVISEADDIPVTDSLVSYQGSVSVQNKSVVAYYSKNKINPSTDTDVAFARRTRQSWNNEEGWDNKSIW